MTSKPRFVNLQPVVVIISGQRPGEMIPLHPWGSRKPGEPLTSKHVLEGEHYAQFVSDKGPLYPFPVEEGAADGAIASDAAVSQGEIEVQVDDVQDTPQVEESHADAEVTTSSADVMRQLEIDANA